MPSSPPPHTLSRKNSTTITITNPNPPFHPIDNAKLSLHKYKLTFTYPAQNACLSTDELFMPLQNMLLAMLFGFFFHTVMKQLIPVIHLFKIHKLISIQSRAFTNSNTFFCWGRRRSEDLLPCISSLAAFMGKWFIVNADLLLQLLASFHLHFEKENQDIQSKK